MLRRIVPPQMLLCAIVSLTGSSVTAAMSAVFSEGLLEIRSDVPPSLFADTYRFDDGGALEYISELRRAPLSTREASHMRPSDWRGRWPNLNLIPTAVTGVLPAHRSVMYFELVCEQAAKAGCVFACGCCESIRTFVC